MTRELFLPRATIDELLLRIGMVNLFNPFLPDQTYHLNLDIYEHWRTAQQV